MNKEQTIALCIIVKDTKEEIEAASRAIRSVGSYVDNVYVTLNSKTTPKSVPEEFKDLKVTLAAWENDFSKARNYNFSQAKEDWILWIDADDEVLHPENLSKLVEKAERYNCSGWYFKYLYERDKEGNVVTWHWKIRLIKNDGHGTWKGRIHEDYIQEREVNWLRTEDVVINHLSTPERAERSVVRNLRMLIEDLKEQGDNPDPRTLYYLATAFIEAGDDEKAARTIEQYLERSGWDEERYEAHLQLARIHIRAKQYEKAEQVFMEALKESPQHPDAYFGLASLYQVKNDWNRCIQWSETGFKKKPSETMLMQFPQEQTWKPIAVYAYALMNVGRLQEAFDAIQNVVKMAPNDKYLKELRGMIGYAHSNKEITKMYVKLAKYLRDAKQEWRIPALIQSVPTQIQDNALMTKLKVDFLPERRWPKKSIVFYCGNTVEPWSPKSLDRGGIGGSETAVMQLSKRLAKMGWDVTVYTWCDDEEGKYDGVKYENYWKMHPNDIYDVFVIWRTPVFLDANIQARKMVVDLHDVPNALEYTEERVKKLDYIFVKSKHHADYLINVPKEKIVVAPNGIDIGRYERMDENRVKGTMIYSSSPNRGLDILIDKWPEIRKRVPDAMLYIFYGWKTFYELQKHNPEQMKWMKKLQKKVEKQKDNGVVDMGRVGQKELAQWQKKAAVWAYPTYFPEISCITAMEVQAAGCVPVCTDYAALEETVQNGHKISGDIWNKDVQNEWLDALVKELKYPMNDDERQKMSDWAKDAYSWNVVADKWSKTLE